MNTNKVAQSIFEHALKHIDKEGIHEFVAEDNVFFKYWLTVTPLPEVIVYEIYENDIEQPVTEVANLVDEMLFDTYILNQ